MEKEVTEKKLLICGDTCKTGDKLIPNRGAILENVANHMKLIGVDVEMADCQGQCRYTNPGIGVVSAATKVEVKSDGSTHKTPYAIGLTDNGPAVKSRAI